MQTVSWKQKQTDKNIFVYKLLLSLNILNFSLFFKVKTGTLLKKLPRSFPATVLKIESLSSPPIKPLCWGLNPQAEMGGMHIMVTNAIQEKYDFIQAFSFYIICEL